MRRLFKQNYDFRYTCSCLIFAWTVKSIVMYYMYKTSTEIEIFKLFRLFSDILWPLSLLYLKRIEQSFVLQHITKIFLQILEKNCLMFPLCCYTKVTYKELKNSFFKFLQCVDSCLKIQVRHTQSVSKQYVNLTVVKHRNKGQQHGSSIILY